MKKLFALLLTLTLALSLTVPAFATGNEGDDWRDSPFQQGYDKGFAEGHDKGYAAGKADALALTPQLVEPADIPLSDEPTYEEGYQSGLAGGYYVGYDNGYTETAGRYPAVDRPIVEKGGVPGQVNVMMEGQCIQFPDAIPTIVNDRTMIPVRAVMENLGQLVEWDPDTRTVTIMSPTVEQTILLTIDSTTAVVTRGEFERIETTLDAPAFINEDDRTMVPLRFLSETCGYTVLWDNTFRTAVVVDDDALMADIDSRFTALNALMASQQADQMGKKLKESGSLSADITIADVDGAGTEVALPFSAAYTAWSDSQSARIEMTFNLKEALTALETAVPGILEEMEVDLGTALTTDLIAIPLTLLLTPEGTMYLHMPLVNSLFLGASTPENTWLSLGATGVDLSQPASLTMGQALVPSLLVDEGSFQLWDTLDLSLAIVEAMFGDAVASTRGGSTTWTADLTRVLDAAGLEDPEAEAILDSFTLKTTMGKNGSYAITGGMDYADDMMAMDFALNASGTAKGGKMTMTMSLSDLFSLELASQTSITPVSTLPAMTLPAGAEVVDLTDF